jgi:hypothetical protein
MRTKTIELDGAKWTIAPLTMREIEEFLSERKEMIEMPEGAAQDRQAAKLWNKFLAMGLNNVHRLEDGKWPQPKPTMVEADEIPDRLDLHSFETLRDELLIFSRLAEKAAPRGEALAAS